MLTTRVRWLGSLVLLAGMLIPTSLRAERIVSGTSVNGLGTFRARFGYKSLSPTLGVVVVKLRNTTPFGDGGFLTSFAFNLPDAPISGVGLLATDPDFGLLGGRRFNNSVRANPFGYFDVGAGVGPTWGGSTSTESLGFERGEGGIFAFAITGRRLDRLTTEDFLTSYSTDPGIGGSQFFAVRFRDIDTRRGDFNDAVGGEVGGGGRIDTLENPEPGTLTLGMLGLAGASILSWRRSRKKREESLNT